jgi:hypothetical protein
LNVNVSADSEAAPTSGAPAEPAAWPLAVGASSIQGRVDFTGAVPPAVRLHREVDPYCARTEMFDPAVSVKNGGLANVWIHVTKGAPDAPAPSTVVAIDQKNCMYVPRVAAAVVGQRIVAKNGDPVLHNVHAFLGASTLFNKAWPTRRPPHSSNSLARKGWSNGSATSTRGCAVTSAFRAHGRIRPAR